MAYGFINFLFLFLSYISFIFSFSYSVFTDQFPLYHHWSPSPVFFFPFCLLSPLCSISESPIGVGLVVGLWFPIVISMGVSLWVVGLWIQIVIGVGLCSILSRWFTIRCFQSRQFTVLSLKVSSIRSTSTTYK